LLKFGLLFLLANLFLKLFIGIGLWKMAIENKYTMKSSLKYTEEQIEEGDPTILRGKNDNQRRRIFPNSGAGDGFEVRESVDED